MKNLKAIGALLACTVMVSGAFASGLPENFIHPDKITKSSKVGFKAKKKQVSSDLLGDSVSDIAQDFNSDCSVGCSESCVTLARRIVNDCSGSPVPGGPTSPGFAACVDQMTAFFHARAGTSGAQDSADAVSYCVSGADVACPSQLSDQYFHLRQGTTGAQDLSDAATFCKNGVTSACMAVVYPTMHSRPGTTATQDVNDAAAACQRQPSF